MYGVDPEPVPYMHHVAKSISQLDRTKGRLFQDQLQRTYSIETEDS